MNNWQWHHPTQKNLCPVSQLKSIEHNGLYYERPYEELLNLKVNDSSSKKYLNKTTHKKCWLCKKTDQETKFKKIAHVIPCFFGNERIFCSNECDCCNEHLGAYERALAAYLRLPLNTLGISGRSGVPTIKRKNGSKIASSSNKDRERKVIISDFQENQSSIDKKNYELEIRELPTESFIPTHALKALVSIAMRAYPMEKVDTFPTSLLSWLKGEVDYDSSGVVVPYIQFRACPTAPHPHPLNLISTVCYPPDLISLSLHERNDIPSVFPRIHILITVGSLEIQFGIWDYNESPDIEIKNKKALQCIQWLTNLDYFEGLKVIPKTPWKKVDLTSEEKTSLSLKEMKYHFQKVEENLPLEQLIDDLESREVPRELCYSFGSHYRNGKDVPKNLEKAKFWFKKSAKGKKGDPRAKEALKELEQDESNKNDSGCT